MTASHQSATRCRRAAHWRNATRSETLRRPHPNDRGWPLGVMEPSATQPIRTTGIGRGRSGGFGQSNCRSGHSLRHSVVAAPTPSAPFRHAASDDRFASMSRSCSRDLYSRFCSEWRRLWESAVAMPAVQALRYRLNQSSVRCQASLAAASS